MKKEKISSTLKDLRDRSKSRMPLSVWFIGYFVGLKKELVRTRWLKGKKLGFALWKVLLIIITSSLILFGINYLIFEIFGSIGVV